ncbi:MAG: hypothetical protein NXH95_17400 [Pseudomonadaceae bacterium]|nr:hypothetical protein [Pseudomonadaceae bacterium]
MTQEYGSPERPKRQVYITKDAALLLKREASYRDSQIYELATEAVLDWLTVNAEDPGVRSTLDLNQGDDDYDSVTK